MKGNTESEINKENYTNFNMNNPTAICEIILDANNHCDGVYHSGQQLTGNIVLTFYGKQKVKSK